MRLRQESREAFFSSLLSVPNLEKKNRSEVLRYMQVPQLREELLPRQTRRRIPCIVYWLPVTFASLAAALTITVLVQVIAHAAEPYCRQKEFEPCGPLECCIRGTDCVRRSNASLCVPKCSTPLWGRCDGREVNDSYAFKITACCPPSAVCVPHTDTLSVCVPVVPKLYVFGRLRM